MDIYSPIMPAVRRRLLAIAAERGAGSNTERRLETELSNTERGGAIDQEVKRSGEKRPGRAATANRKRVRA